MSIIFDKNAKHEKLKTPLNSVKKYFFEDKKQIKKIKTRIKIIFLELEKKIF